MTGQQTLEWIAEVTGIPVTSLRVLARDLREARKDLWPEGKKGGRSGSAHVEPHHLAAILIAILQGVVAGASKTVLDASLYTNYKTNRNFGKFSDSIDAALDKWFDSCNGLNFISFLTWLIDDFSEPENRKPFIEAADISFNFGLMYREDLGAQFNISLQHDGISSSLFIFSEVNLTQKKLQDRERFLTPLVVSRSVSLEFIVALSECWRNTKSLRSKSEPDPSIGSPVLPGTREPQSESLSLPGEGTSTPKRLKGSDYPQTYRDGFPKRPDGRSRVSTESSPVCIPAPHTSRRSHARDCRQHAFA